MYKLNEQNQVETSPENLPNWSGFNRYLSSLPVQERQAQGWFKNVVTEAGLTTPYVSSELDAVIVAPTEEKNVQAPFEFSPLKMELEIEQRGKEIGIDGLALLDSIIEQAGMMRMYKRASALSSGDERVVQLVDAIGHMLDWTDEEQQAILEKCRI